MQEYLKQLIEFYPQSANQVNVKELLAYVQAHFDSHGLKTAPLIYNGYHNLYAHTTNNKTSKLLLQAHIDVVPGQDQLFSTANGKYFGRGVYDMLFATACYMKLCDELQQELKNLDLAFMLSGDEELGGFNGVQPFLEAGYSTEICVLPDAGQGFGTLNVAAKGIYNIKIRIHGKAHHGSRPWEGDGAAIKLVHCLAEIEKIFDSSSTDNSTCTVAMIQAGEVDNQGPSYADATLDIRYSTKADLERIKNAINKLLKAYQGVIIELMEGDDYQLDTTHPLVRDFIGLYQKHTGKTIELVKAHGSSDARFFSEKNIPVIMLRPDGGGAHGDNEWISVKGVEDFYKLLKDFVIKVATIK